MACGINSILSLHMHDEQLVGQRYMAWGRRNINIHGLGSYLIFLSASNRNLTQK